MGSWHKVWAPAILAGACASTAPSGITGDPARGREVFVSREAGHCVLCHHGPDAGARQGGGASGRGFGSAEALALYRLNALDASVKGALEHGI